MFTAQWNIFCTKFTQWIHFALIQLKLKAKLLKITIIRQLSQYSFTFNNITISWRSFSIDVHFKCVLFSQLQRHSLLFRRKSTLIINYSSDTLCKGCFDSVNSQQSFLNTISNNKRQLTKCTTYNLFTLKLICCYWCRRWIAILLHHPSLHIAEGGNVLCKREKWANEEGW